MVDIAEGYICPECLHKFDSEAVLISHFENNHNQVNEITKYYKNLFQDQFVDEKDSYNGRLEEIILSIIDDSLTPESIPEIGLKPKLMAFLKEKKDQNALNNALISRLVSERDSAQNEVVQLRNNSEAVISELRNKLIAREEELEQVAKQVLDLKRELDAAEKEHNNNSAVVERSESTEVDCAKELDELKALRNTLSSILSMGNANIEDLVDKIRCLLAMSETNDGKLSNKIEVQTPVDELENEISSLKAAVKELNNVKVENDALRKKAITLQLELQDKANALKVVRTEFDSARMDTDALKISLSEAQKITEEKVAIIQTLQDEKADLVQNLETKSIECEQLQKQIYDLTSASNSLNETNTKLCSDLDAVKAQLVTATASENTLKQKLAEMDTTVVSQRKILASHDAAVAELESKLSSTLGEHQALMDQIIASQNKCQQLESALHASHQEMEGLQRIVLDLGRQNQALQITQERLINRQWVSDESAHACSNCQKEFSISLRKHHCRHCGKVFCQACSSKKTATSASKDPLRVCDSCFTELTGIR